MMSEREISGLSQEELWGTSPTVETYNLTARNGRHIRKATRVRFSDGSTVDFTELLPKGEALRQAQR